MLDKYVWTNAHTQVSLLAGRDSLWLARALGARRTTFRILFLGTQIVHPRARCGQRGYNRTPPETSPPSSARGQTWPGTVLDSDPAFSPCASYFALQALASTPLARDWRGLLGQSHDRGYVSHPSRGGPGDSGSSRAVVLDTVGASGPQPHLARVA